MKFFFRKFSTTALIFLASCVNLAYDETKAYPLVTVSRTMTPAHEEIRSFELYGDLIYVAAGSGGILVYRMLGDSVEPALNLSLTNLYAGSLEQVFVRTIEIIETPGSTNLIFAYDTVSGGGIGAAEISPEYTRPLGSLKVAPNLRIRRTHTTPDPEGGFRIIAANEYLGVLTYHLTYSSNSFFERPDIASLVNYVALSGLELPARLFSKLAPPSESNSLASVTNADALLRLLLEGDSLPENFLSNIPFLSEKNRVLIERAFEEKNKIQAQPTVSNIIEFAQDVAGTDVVDIVLQNSNAIAAGVGNILSQEGLGEVLQDPGRLVSNIESTVQDAVESGKPTETLFEEAYLSNLNLLAEYSVDLEEVHDTNYNPFTNRRPIPNARKEIEATAEFLGRRIGLDGQSELKSQLMALSAPEMTALFEALFSQANLLTKLVPLFESSGLDPKQLYRFWQEGRYLEIINAIDTRVLAEIFRLLPRYKIDTSIKLVKTNLIMPSVRNMTADARSLYLAAGTAGFAVADRNSGKILKTITREFSEVESVVPFEAHRKKYLAVVDRLDGLTIYERKARNVPGELVAHLNLIGEGLGLYVYEDIIWIADGSNGILGVRFNPDKTLTIEAETYQKEGIARYVAAGRRREIMASYGSDGLVRLRITNITENQAKSNAQDETNQTKDLAERTLEWRRNSRFVRFLRKIIG